MFREKPLAHWLAWFEGMDVSFAPVNTLREALDDANVRARRSSSRTSDGREHIAPVVRFLHEPAEPSLREPALDEHTRFLAPRRNPGRDTCAAPRKSHPAAPAPTSAAPMRISWSGDIYEHRPGRTITEADNTWFTLLTMNQHPLHFDAAYAAETEFKKPLVNSCLTLAIVTGMSVADISQKAIANMGWSKVELTAPVFAGDTIYAESEVLAKRPSRSRPGQGLVTVRTRGLKADGTVFMTFERTVLVPMADGE